MKKILRKFVVNTFVLYLVTQIAMGMEFANGFRDIVLTGLGLTAANMVVKPVINILMLPINLITFNLFKWLGAAIALYLVTLIVPGFSISAFSFAGYSSDLFVLPAMNFSGVLAYIAFSLTITLFGSVIFWLIK